MRKKWSKTVTFEPPYLTPINVGRKGWDTAIPSDDNTTGSRMKGRRVRSVISHYITSSVLCRLFAIQPLMNVVRCSLFNFVIMCEPM